jgi:hypothetical protein
MNAGRIIAVFAGGDELPGKSRRPPARDAARACPPEAGRVESEPRRLKAQLSFRHFRRSDYETT